MLNEFWNIVFVLSIFIGVLVFILLAFFDRNRRHSNVVLAIYILCFVLLAAHNVLLSTGLILEIPWAYRSVKPLQYAVIPLMYIYVRSVIYNEVHFRKWDWMFFMPAVLHAVELIPFYLMPIEKKQDIVEQFLLNMNVGLRHTEGFLPAFVHPILIFSMAGIGITLVFRLLMKASRDRARFNELQNRIQIRWLTLFTSINAALAGTLLVHLIIHKRVPWNTYKINTVEGALVLIIVAVALFFHPVILYGFRGEKPIVPLEPENAGEQAILKKSGSFTIAEQRREEYLKRIKDHFEQEKAYLTQGYSIKKLSEDTGIPYTYLSQLINQEYGLNFNELVNSYRIEYVKKLLLEPGANQYTFEALAEKAGFSSRTTFSRAFSRFAGCTASDYVKQAHPR